MKLLPIHPLAGFFGCVISALIFLWATESPVIPTALIVVAFGCLAACVVRRWGRY